MALKLPKNLEPIHIKRAVDYIERETAELVGIYLEHRVGRISRRRDPPSRRDLMAEYVALFRPTGCPCNTNGT